MLNKIVAAAAVSGLVMASAGWAQAQEREQLLHEITRVIEDDGKREAAIRAGRERTLLCAQCHGQDGNSPTSDVPNLASQNPTYLLEQISMFADGRRRNFVMESLAKIFTFEDKVNMAIFYSTQPVRPSGGDPVLAARGEPIFQRSCQVCHGADGRGEEGYALLAGQQVDYTISALRRYRANAHGETNARNRTRANARMEAVTMPLSDAEIEALAHYINRLR